MLYIYSSNCIIFFNLSHMLPTRAVFQVSLAVAITLAQQTAVIPSLVSTSTVAFVVQPSDLVARIAGGDRTFWCVFGFWPFVSFTSRFLISQSAFDTGEFTGCFSIVRAFITQCYPCSSTSRQGRFECCGRVTRRESVVRPRRQRRSRLSPWRGIVVSVLFVELCSRRFLPVAPQWWCGGCWRIARVEHTGRTLCRRRG